MIKLFEKLKILIVTREDKAEEREKKQKTMNHTEHNISGYNRGKRFSFANQIYNEDQINLNKNINKFNIVINKKILKENYDENVNESFAEQDEEKKNLFNAKKSEKKPLSVSGCNSLVNSTRNLNSLNKQFSFNNEAIEETVNMMNSKKPLSFNYPNPGK